MYTLIKELIVNDTTFELPLVMTIYNLVNKQQSHNCVLH